LRRGREKEKEGDKGEREKELERIIRRAKKGERHRLK
jgi:hypothetical protein